MAWVNSDGGRASAGFKGNAGDCAARAIAICRAADPSAPTGEDYKWAYDALNRVAKRERTGRRKRKRSDARTGVYRASMRWLLEDELGWSWTPTMQVGQGCKVHLAAGELPTGRLVVSLSRHYAAVIDGVLHDNHDSSRGGTRCVYGYWTAPAVNMRPMPRGGAREGAGRPGIDWAKKVDVRLTQAQLDTLDAYRALYEVEDHKGDPRPLSRPEALRHLIDVHAAADVAEGGLR